MRRRVKKTFLSLRCGQDEQAWQTLNRKDRPVLTSSQAPDKPEEHDRPYRRRHESADTPQGDDAEELKDKAADKRPEDADDEVSQETESATLGQLSCKPPCRDPDNQKPYPVHDIPFRSSLHTELADFVFFSVAVPTGMSRSGTGRLLASARFFAIIKR